MNKLVESLQSMEYSSNDLIRNAVEEEDEATRSIIRKKIYAFEKQIHSVIDNGEAEQEDGNVKHYFTKGIYAREITIPAETVMTSKLHKLPRLCIISKGDVSFTTEMGTKRIRAPYTAVFPPGSKVALFTHTETVWTAIHGTDEINLESLEDNLIAKDHEEYFDFKNSLIEIEFTTKGEMQ